jgi:tripartite-type tricarboxylate transporter receptor subunit TctC
MQFKTRILAVASATVAALAIASLAPAQAAYPEKPVKFVCWSAAGSPMDVFVRKFASLMTNEIGQPMPVENRPGGSGAVAMSYLMSQPADGYTIMNTSSSMTFTMAEGKIPFKPDDFTVLRVPQAEPSSLAVRKDSPFKTLPEFVDYLKKNPNGLKIGGFGSFGFNLWAFHLLQEKSGIQAAWIPFDGGNQAALALLGGHIDATSMTPSSALAQIENGDIRLLGVTLPERSKFLPDVPTMKEQGYDVQTSIWRGVMVKKGTPQEAVDVLNKAMDKVMASKEWIEFQDQRKQLTLTWSMDEIARVVVEDLEKQREFFVKGGFKK